MIAVVEACQGLIFSRRATPVIVAASRRHFRRRHNSGVPRAKSGAGNDPLPSAIHGGFVEVVPVSQRPFLRPVLPDLRQDRFSEGPLSVCTQVGMLYRETFRRRHSVSVNTSRMIWLSIVERRKQVNMLPCWNFRGCAGHRDKIAFAAHGFP